MSLLDSHHTEPPIHANPVDLEQSIGAHFQRMAQENPHRIAIGSGPWQPTYSQLDVAANVLAHGLMEQGAPQDRVAILVQHGAGLILAVLAVLKAGRVVVVLNPTDPPARLEHVLDDADPAILVTDVIHRDLANRIAHGTRPVILLEDDAHHAGDAAPMNPSAPAAPHDLAFLVYTSGSTGRPKGVMQTHRNVLHNAFRLSCGMMLTPDDRIALLTSLTGGQGIATTSCALFNGASLCPFPVMDKGVTGLADWLLERKISVYVSAATLFRHFVRTLPDGRKFPDVRLVRLGAESATSDDFQAFREHFSEDCILFHTLSASETGNITQYALTPATPVRTGRLPVGRPHAGVEVRLVDEGDREVPLGQTGEMVVQGHYLSPGYWRNQALTDLRFSAEGSSGDLRSFRSGDLARRMPDGSLEFIGRKDTQVKIRGYRVEISEVEQALSRLPEVDKAVVYLQGSPEEEAHLVACVVPRDGQTCTSEVLRRGLRSMLPAHMVPAFFVVLPAFPLSAGGKIDRERLRQLGTESPESAPAEAPVSAMESLLAGIWAEVFPQHRIGREAHFFDLGGDSLSAAVIAARVHAALRVELDLQAFADHPTLADLALFIDGLHNDTPHGGRAPAALELHAVPRDGPLPLSYAQGRFWKYARKRKAVHSYTVTHIHRIRGPLNVPVLRDAMSFLIERHEILRTTFGEVGGQGVQMIHPPQPAELPVLDFSAAPDPEQQALRLLQNKAREPFDLARGPLLRYSLVHIRPDEHWLLRVHHHLISDASSWIIYHRELALTYEALLQGRPPPLSVSQPLQYADYAAWQRKALNPDDPAYRRDVDWWAGMLGGAAPVETLPFSRRWKNYFARPADGVIWWGLEPFCSQRLDALARSRNATFYTLRLAAFAALLAWRMHRPHIVVGTYLTNRYHVETQNIFGPLVNFARLPLRPDFSRPFSEWLSAVRSLIGEVQARSAIPNDLLCEELRRRGVTPPEIHAVFAMTFHTAPIRFGGLEVTWVQRRYATMPWRFTLSVDRYTEADHCHAAFDARIHDPSRVRDFIASYVRFLNAVSRHPDHTLDDLLGAPD